MNETPFFFDGNGYRLFGVLHKPMGHIKKEGFVFCAPFAEEKLWVYRVLVNFARDLAVQGWPVLRFDYMGNGDSEGDFEESSVETMRSDIRCAVRALKEKVPGIESAGLLGLRFGATLAAFTASSGGGIGRLVLWEPVLNGAGYMREMLRINIATQSAVYKEIRHNTEALIRMMQEGQTVNIDGYEMSWPLYEQCGEINLLNGGIFFPGRSLLVQIGRKEGEIANPYKELQTRLGDCEASLAVEDPFWKETRRYYGRAENLFRVTREWLEK
jgi:exosortase A-associated hydrolase 2